MHGFKRRAAPFLRTLAKRRKNLTSSLRPKDACARWLLSSAVGIISPTSRSLSAVIKPESTEPITAIRAMGPNNRCAVSDITLNTREKAAWLACTCSRWRDRNSSNCCESASDEEPGDRKESGAERHDSLISGRRDWAGDSRCHITSGPVMFQIGFD